MTNGTAGLTWYLTAYARIMVNYLYSDIAPGGGAASGRMHGLGWRFQMDF